jgi:hypothetical protein
LILNMANVWMLAGVVAFAAGLAVWRRHRRKSDISISSDPVSGQWLAEARARGEEHTW